MIPMKALIQYCRKLPFATEDVKWDNDLVFSVGGKMFAVFDQGRGEQLSFKASTEEFARLTKLPGVEPAPYLARAHWVAVRQNAKLPTPLLKELLKEANVLVFKKLPKTAQVKLAKEKRSR